ncbi:TPA: hypothetical protein N0F65_001316, partial [Lagenidium giganteum]
RVFPLVHISRLKPYVSQIRRPTERVQVEGTLAFDQALLPEDSWLGEEVERDEYEVEEPIVRNGRRKREYLLKWVGYEEQSWVAEEDLSCTSLLYEFDARRAWENRREAA